MVDLETALLSAAIVATSINSLLTTITLLHQVNEKMKLLHALQTVTSTLATVVKTPFKRRPAATVATAGTVRKLHSCKRKRGK
jgi:hypothetical protein